MIVSVCTWNIYIIIHYADSITYVYDVWIKHVNEILLNKKMCAKLGKWNAENRVEREFKIVFVLMVLLRMFYTSCEFFLMNHCREISSSCVSAAYFNFCLSYFLLHCNVHIFEEKREQTRLTFFSIICLFLARYLTEYEEK